MQYGRGCMSRLGEERAHWPVLLLVADQQCQAWVAPRRTVTSDFGKMICMTSFDEDETLFGVVLDHAAGWKRIRTRLEGERKVNGYSHRVPQPVVPPCFSETAAVVVESGILGGS